MKRLLAVALAAAFVASVWMSLPQPPRPAAEQRAGGHAAHGAGQVTISHGPLANLGMGAMTMGFQLADRALLQALPV